MYIYINEGSVRQYNGEVLKRYINNNLVKAISNPTVDELIEFGYKPLIETDRPNYDDKTQYIVEKYIDHNDRIEKLYIVENMVDEV